MSAYSPSRASNWSWVPLFDNAPFVEHNDVVRSHDGGDAVGDEDGGALGMMSRRRVRICSSVRVSTLAKASSRMRIFGCRTTERARAVRCFCPPDRVTPRSPTMVSSPWGKVLRSAASWATSMARSTSSVAAESRAMLSRMLSETGRCPAARSRWRRERSAVAFVQWVAVDENLALAGLDEAGDEPGQRALAEPDPPDDGQGAAGRNVNVDIAQHGLAIVRKGGRGGIRFRL